MKESEMGADVDSSTGHAYTDGSSLAGSDHSGQLVLVMVPINIPGLARGAIKARV